MEEPRNLTERKETLLDRVLPPRRWRPLFFIMLGIFFGLCLTAFHISNASSYLSDDPETCINCHVMYPQYASWQHSSHREWANCGDCHVPHDNFVVKYLFKANDGMRHATIFTLRAEPQVIRIKDAGAAVVQRNCIRCHYEQIHDVSAMNITFQSYQEGAGLLCWDCHREVPHSTVRSLSSAPNAIVPEQKSAIPEWLKIFIGTKNKE